MHAFIVPGFVLAAAMFAAPVAFAAAEHTADARVELGSDSNPYRLNNVLNPASGLYTELEMKLARKVPVSQRQELLFEGKVRYHKLEPDLDDGDRLDVDLKLGWQDAHRNDGRWGLKRSLVLEAGWVDKTYIDRTTGVASQTAGQPTEDRFDYSDIKLSGGLDFRSASDTRWLLGAEVRRKNYTDDYGELGLVRLDYDAFEVEPGVRRRLSEAVLLKLDLPLTWRAYRQREAKTLNGDAVPGSDLEYFYYGWDAELEIELSQRWSIEPELRGYVRRDNQDGFADVRKYTVALQTNFKPDNRSVLKLAVSYGDRDFTESANRTVDPGEDTDRARSQLRLGARYERALSWIPVTAFVEARYRDVDNDNSSFSYDRSVFTIGLHSGAGLRGGPRR